MMGDTIKDQHAEEIKRLAAMAGGISHDKRQGDERRRANDIQVGGNHYQQHAIQPWDFIHSNGMGFLAGNVVKYVSRYQDKNGVEDLKKARHYLDKLIEEEEHDLPSHRFPTADESLLESANTVRKLRGGE